MLRLIENYLSSNNILQIIIKLSHIGKPTKFTVLLVHLVTTKAMAMYCGQQLKVLVISMSRHFVYKYVLTQCQTGLSTVDRYLHFSKVY